MSMTLNVKEMFIFVISDKSCFIRAYGYLCSFFRCCIAILMAAMISFVKINETHSLMRIGIIK